MTGSHPFICNTNEIVKNCIHKLISIGLPKEILEYNQKSYILCVEMYLITDARPD